MNSASVKREFSVSLVFLLCATAAQQSNKRLWFIQLFVAAV